MSNDLAGVWEVALSDGVHRIEFEHGTTTGKRVIYVDGKVGLMRYTQVIKGEEGPTCVPHLDTYIFHLYLPNDCRRS